MPGPVIEWGPAHLRDDASEMLDALADADRRRRSGYTRPSGPGQTVGLASQPSYPRRSASGSRATRPVGAVFGSSERTSSGQNRCQSSGATPRAEWSTRESTRFSSDSPQDSTERTRWKARYPARVSFGRGRASTIGDLGESVAKLGREELLDVFFGGALRGALLIPETNHACL